MVGDMVDGVRAIDGKTACGSRDGRNTALHKVISAYLRRSGLCLAQESTRGKGIEISRRCSRRSI
jgi:hypothetical protein